jgi:hypothetical protein
MEIKHKVTKKLSQIHSETVEAECVCGWYYRLGTYSIHSKSMRKVRQELSYYVRDHIEEMAELAAAEKAN